MNQILSKLDGVNAIDNILLIGMTNRRELLDSALLRPGRLEVQIEVPMPDKEGRREISQIHFGTLRERGRLSKQLCYAIDGLPYIPNLAIEDDNSETEIDNSESINERKRDKLKRGLTTLFQKVRPCYDLAAETEGFSGADIAGLVRSVRFDHSICGFLLRVYDISVIQSVSCGFVNFSLFFVGRFFGFISGSQRWQWCERHIDHTRGCKASGRRSEEIAFVV